MIFNRLLSLCFAVMTFCITYSQINTDRVMSIGKNALYFEDYVLAIQYFNQVIGAKPYLAEPYFCRAVAKISLEDYVGAENDCDLALERNPFIVKAYHCRGIARINQNKTEEALADFEKGLEFDTRNQNLITCKGLVLMQDKKYEDARNQFDLAIKYQPKNPQSYLYRSRSYLLEEDTVRAMQDANHAISLDKYNPDGLALRAMIYYEEQKYENAIADLDEAIRLSSPRVDLYVNRALARYQKMELVGAMEDYDKAIEIDSDNSLARFNRGLLRFEVGDYNNAVEDFNQVILLEPDNQLALYNRALLLTKIGNYKQAIRDFSLLIEQNPDYAPLYYARAEAKRLNLDNTGAQIDSNTGFVIEQKARKQKNKKSKDDEESENTRKKSDKSIRKYNKLVAADPEEAEKRISYRNDYRGKVQNVNTEITLEPSYFISYYKPTNRVGNMAYNSFLQYFNRDYNVGQELLLTNEDKKLSTAQVADHFNSISAWSDSLKQNISKIALFGRALDYYYVGDYERSLEDMNVLMTLETDNPMLYFVRANIYVHKVQFSNASSDNAELNNLAHLSVYAMAEADLQRCIELFPNFPFAYYNLANLQVIRKDYQAALSNYDMALKLDKQFAEAYYNRGITNIYLGNKSLGVINLSKSGELGIYKSYNVIKRYSE